MVDLDRKQRLEDIGARIKERRSHLGITQEDLRGAAGISKSFLSEIETGQRAASGLNYLRLAEALDVDVGWLLTGEEALSESSDSERANAIPEIVERVAMREGWAHPFTMEVAAALNGVIARRSRWGSPRTFTEEQVVRLASALRENRGNGSS